MRTSTPASKFFALNLSRTGYSFNCSLGLKVQPGCHNINFAPLMIIESRYIIIALANRT
jgi:hypothetical protein